jgi:hypothetical protein
VRVERGLQVSSRMVTLLLALTAAACGRTESSGPTGTTHYVDNCVVVGDDSNNGTSPSAPWLTINKVNKSAFNPGDSILFERTCTWREQLNVPSSGAAGSPITFGAYGTGAAPIISGADVFSSWTAEGSLYYSPAPVQPNQVFRDGVRLAAVPSQASLATGDWWWDSVNNRIYVYDDPGALTIEASQRDYCILNLMDYLTVQNIDTRNANGYGVAYSANSGPLHLVSVTGVNSQNNYKHGIYVSDDSTGNGIANVTLSGNTTAGNGLSGIEVTTTTAPVSPVLIARNLSHDDDWRADVLSSAAIHLYGPTITNWTVTFNVVYDAGSALSNFKAGSVTGTATASGIYGDTMGSSGLVGWNLVHDNNWAGIIVEHTDGAVVYANLSYNNGQVGLGAVNRAHNNLFYNNTAYANEEAFAVWASPSMAGGLTGNRLENNIGTRSTVANLVCTNGGENDGANGSGNVYAYNGFGPATTNFITWGASNFSTYATWEAAAGNCGTAGCSHSVQADPAFVNASAAQFWLLPASAAIDAGANLGSPYNIGLLPGGSWPNSVVTGDQNSYGTGWEVGAYIFPRQ